MAVNQPLECIRIEVVVTLGWIEGLRSSKMRQGNWQGKGIYRRQP
jgi:hypothetical protein